MVCFFFRMDFFRLKRIGIITLYQEQKSPERCARDFFNYEETTYFLPLDKALGLVAGFDRIICGIRIKTENHLIRLPV